MRIRRRSRVTGMTADGTGWKIQPQNRNDHAAWLLVVALPRQQATRLLLPVLHELRDLHVAPAPLSSVSVSLAFSRFDVEHPLQASGFVIAREDRVPEHGGLLACSCSSSKLPGRAPAGRVLLRAFYRPDGTCPISTNDGIWVRRALEDLALTLGIHGRPVRSWVARWPNAFSRNDRDLRVSAERLAGALCHRRHIQLAGSAFFGAGALPAMESGRRAARRLLGIQAACAEFDESQVRPGTRDAST